MASDEQRREVAEMMRGYDVSEFKESAIVPFLECLGHGYTDWRGVLDELADLIDRPTCHDAGGTYTFRCSKCGCAIDIFKEIVFSDCDSVMTVGDDCLYSPRYCPWCGAEVVER